MLAPAPASAGASTGAPVSIATTTQLCELSLLRFYVFGEVEH